MTSEEIVFGIEMIGTVAFSSSGAMVGIHKKMDIFGVLVMGITTAVGGGIIRDLVLGIHPPNTFRNPIYVQVAIITALILFAIIYWRKQMMESQLMIYYEKMMAVMDAIGLGAFTVIGIYTAWERSYQDHLFLLLFVGVVTGVGGGVMRDVMAMQMPYIFVKHIYACASLAGAIVCVYFMHYHVSIGMVLGASTVIIIRLLAAKYRWNLPKIDIQEK